MKKSLLLTGLVAASTAASYGQGQIHFSNYFSATAPVVGTGALTGTAGGPGLGASYSAQLAYFIGATTDSTALTPLNYNDGLGDVSPVAFGLGVATGNGTPYSGWFD